MHNSNHLIHIEMNFKNTFRTLPILIVFLLLSLDGLGQLGAETLNKAPDRVRGEGPWNQLIIRGVTLIDGTLSPPLGPIDIVVEKNRIKSIHLVGALSSYANCGESSALIARGKDLDAKAMFMMPEFVDTHIFCWDKK